MWLAQVFISCPFNDTALVAVVCGRIQLKESLQPIMVSVVHNSSSIHLLEMVTVQNASYPVMTAMSRDGMITACCFRVNTCRFVDSANALI